MKQNAILVAAILCFSFAACDGTKLIEDADQSSILEVSFAMDPLVEDNEAGLSTKTTIDPSDYSIPWSANDTIGIYPNSGCQISFLVPESVSAGSASFDGGGWEFKNGAEYRAYYPFIGDYYLDAKNIPVKYTGQKQVGNNNSNLIGPYLATYTSAVSADAGSLHFDFHHLNTFLRPVVELPAGKYTKMTISSDADLFVESGTFDLTSESPVVVADKYSNLLTIDLNITLTATETMTVFVSCAPTDFTGHQLKITIEGTTGNYSYTYNPSKAYVASKIYTLRASSVLYPGEVPIEFVDADVKAICIANWDTNKDGELSYDEAAAVTDLGNAFSGQSITSFNELQYFTGLTSIGDNAFSNCASLAEITIPANITSIGASAFSGCPGLYSITLEPTTPPSLDSGALNTGTESGFVIHVPESAATTYTSAAGWKTYSNSIFTDEAVEFVDMGLSVKWAACDLGVSNPKNEGKNYRWGALSPSPGSMSPYTGTESSLPAEYDIAHLAYGGTWRIPSKAEWEELIDNTTWEFGNGYNGSNGFIVTSRINGNTIFFPTHDTTPSGYTTYSRGHYCWTSDADGKDSAYYAYLRIATSTSNYQKPERRMISTSRTSTFTIRPVMK